MSSSLKTKAQPGKSVREFLDSLENEKRKKDAFALLEIMKETTKEKPILWGTSIIGFGNYHYKSVSGREGDWFPVGFSPRKANLVFYSIPCFQDFKSLVEKLGKVKSSVSCIYIKNLEDVNIDVLKTLIEKSMEAVQNGVLQSVTK